MDHPTDAYNAKYLELLENLPTDLESSESESAMKSFKTFSECRPPEPEPEPDPKPTTLWGKVKAGASCVWESETTRTTIKAAGAFAGVALVVYSTIQKDHVLERQSLNQANTVKPS